MTSNGNGALLEDPILIDPARPLRISPEGMRAVKAATGRQFTDLLQDEDATVQFQVAAFAELFRRANRLGHMPPAVELWQMAAEADLIFEAPQALDPMSGGSSTTSPPSVDIGA